jgi:galactitol PTS system EIIC component
MDLLLEITQTIFSMGASVVLPILITIVAMFFGMKFRNAIIAGMTVGIGFAGLNLVVGLLFEVTGIAQAYYEALGAGFIVTELPWQLQGGIYWSMPFAPLVVPLGVVLNLLLLRFTKIRVLNVDIWNYIHFFGPALMVWTFTGSMFFGILTALACSVIALIFGQLSANDWQKYFGLEGTACSTLYFVSFAWPVSKAIVWVVDHIPGLKKINIRVGEDVDSKWGWVNQILGSPIFIGLFIGVLLGLLTRQSYDVVITMGVKMAAVMFLMPRMVGVLMEGLAQVGTAVRSYIQKRARKQSENAGDVKEALPTLIGMDVALGLGDPNVLTASVLAIPIIIGLTFILPGINFFPIGQIVAVCYTAVFTTMVARGDLFRSLLIITIMMAFNMIMCSVFYPEHTLMWRQAGADIGESFVVGGAFGFIEIPILLIRRLIAGVPQL